MKLEELYEMLSTDFTWDETDLGKEAARTSDLFIKYIKLWSDQNLKLEQLENQFQGLVRSKREYYSGNAPASVYKAKPFDTRVKTDAGIQRYIDGDEDIITAKEKIIVQQQKVKVLEACLDEVKKRGFAISKAIDYYKFINGG